VTVLLIVALVLVALGVLSRRPKPARYRPLSGPPRTDLIPLLECDDCGEKFPFVGYLRVHERKVHGR